MKPLITDSDVLKMKEEERQRRTPVREAISPEESGAGFEKMLDDCVKSRIGSNARKLDNSSPSSHLINSETPLNELPAIGEDVCVPPSERILSNDISVERSMVVDAVTGERTVTVVEKSITKREIDIALAGGDIDYADK
ncbi:hypothetical protein OESDEN_04972 [Oesophagostomum dentatum]|uniref:Uncharacterized protein n=1 Tax=Oesophagostomum dentatum TaxID=61180 RepID=A0A0B1TH06_OESDE|nr:hypothetical protein OESDEN_04972 [Oesophagostomum dentatum]